MNLTTALVYASLAMRFVSRVLCVASLSLVALSGCRQEAPTPTSSATPTLEAGWKAPNFSLMSVDGLRYELHAELAAEAEPGPVVLVFYRGHWCGICRKQLKELQANIGAFETRGAKLIAISSDELDDGKGIVARLGISFPVLSDPTLAAIRAYGVQHTGEDFSFPSMFILRPDATLYWAYVGEGPGDRPELATVLAVLDKMGDDGAIR